MTEELVAIAYEFSPLKANLIRTRLEADGIECFLAGEILTSVVGSFSHAAASWEHPEGNIAIQVRASEADEAREILQELKVGRSDDDDEYGDTQIESGINLAVTLLRLFVITSLSLAAMTLIGSVIDNGWLSGFVGISTFVGLSILAFKKSFKSER